MIGTYPLEIRARDLFQLQSQVLIQQEILWGLQPLLLRLIILTDLIEMQFRTVAIQDVLIIFH